ncbi:MAG: response regulator [Anaerolineales bacterium]|nr:response regulator [Anaerolineales bacterium]
MSTSLKDAHIIVIEDDPNAQLIVLDLLRLGGAQNCIVRKSVNSALAYAENMPRVDLFLVDINMPGKSGYDLLELVRGHDTLRTAKVVAVTAGTLDADVAKARELGFDGFISKPLKMARFAQQVEQVLQGELVWDWR